MPAAASFQPRDRLEVPGDQRQPERVGPEDNASSSSTIPGATFAERSAGRGARTPRPSRPPRPRPAPTHPPRPAGHARSRGPCGRVLDRVDGRHVDAVHATGRGAQRDRVLVRGALEQRAVDVEQQEEQGLAAEVHVRGQPLGERGEQLRGRLRTSLELHHLHRRVHVAQRHAHDQSPSGCRSGRCGSRRRRYPCRARRRRQRERDALRLGRLAAAARRPVGSMRRPAR